MFRERMYDILDLYEEPYDPRYPVIGIDEKPKQLIDDSRMAAPYVQEVNGAEFAGEVVVDGIMPPIRLMPTNAGSSLTFLFEDGGGTASMAMDLDTEVGIIGNYLGLVD